MDSDLSGMESAIQRLNNRGQIDNPTLYDQAIYKMVFLTVQFNGTDRNSYFAGTDQGLGPWH